MRKLKICKAIAVTLVAGMIITGYKGSITKRHYEMAYAGNGSFNSAYRLTEPMTCDYADLDSFVILICTKGACRVSCGEEEVKLTAGHTLLVSAEAENVTLAPEGETTILESYV